MMINIKLRTQINLILLLILIVLLGGGLMIIRQSLQIETILTTIIRKNLANYQIAEALEKALVNQKGFVSYFYLDGNPEWLKQLGEYRQVFNQNLNTAKSLSETDEQLKAIGHIENQYALYVKLKDQVIDHYIKKETEYGVTLHKNVRDLFFSLLTACESYKKIHKDAINRAWEESHGKTGSLIQSVIAIALIAAILVFVLLGILVRQILDPLHRLTLEAGKESSRKDSRDDLRLLSSNVKELIREADLANTKLKQNREILIQSEKLALVGKLAAGMAHSIRNPLTSVKMRLFSLNRTLSLNDSQQDDFAVIAEEIKHLDVILQNFLEFSRPPKLTMMPLSMSAVVDLSLQLLEHRLKSYNVNVDVKREVQLPDVTGDPEQLKEVLVNLIVNACESMGNGGHITIVENTYSDNQNEYARVQLLDSGAGIPESLIDKIFQPFFTTKDEGTGLGLSIAARIIDDHRGFLQVESVPGEGTTFSIILPVSGEDI